MFAIFDQETARPPSGLEVLYQEDKRRRNLFDLKAQKEADERCRATLERVSSSGPATPTSPKQKLELGSGNGFVFLRGAYCHEATREGVHALFSGEVAEWPGVDVVSSAHNAFVRGEPEEDPSRNDASWLLDFYNTFQQFNSHDVMDQALDCLANIRGQFAFVLYDTVLRRVLAARDATGGQPLFWGSSPDGRFMFGSDVADLDACNPSATAFPAGSLYASEGNLVATSPGDKGWVIAGEVWPGRLVSFMPGRTFRGKWRDIKAIPRITSKGMLCGAVYRVASERSLDVTPSNTNKNVF